MWAALPFLTCVLPLNQRAATYDRPELSGPEEVMATADGQFLLHYTMEGDDAVQGNLGNDGVPELVHWAIEGLEIGSDRFQERGYRPLIGDEGGGGTDALDIYMMDIDANGYAYPLDVGASQGNSCYMRLDNGLTIDGVMQSVTIHELHHCVQYRYTARSHSWIYEATATFEQYRAFLDDNLAAAVIVLYSRRLSEPKQPMDHVDGQFEYAGMLVMQFWEQFGGLDPLRIPRLWEALEAEPDWVATFATEAARNWDVSWGEAFLELATWNAFACANNDGSSYDETELPCNEFVVAPINARKWDNGVALARLKLPDPPFSADYFEIEDEEPSLDVLVECESPRTKRAEMGLRLIAVDADGIIVTSVQEFADDEPLSLRLSEPRDPGGVLRLIGVSLGDAPLNVQCAVTQSEPSRAGDPGGCGCSSRPLAPSWLFLAGLFALTRRVRADPPDNSNSSRSLPR